MMSLGVVVLDGCERIVTRGTNEFQAGQVEVSVRVLQTLAAGALMRVELPMWRVAAFGVIVGVARVALVGSSRVVIVDFGTAGGLKLVKGKRKREREEERREYMMACCTCGSLHLFALVAAIRAYREL
mgnify:CR=1 FL=1